MRSARQRAFEEAAVVPGGVAFSADPQQRYMYLADGSNEKVYVMDRQSLEILTSVLRLDAAARLRTPRATAARSPPLARA